MPEYHGCHHVARLTEANCDTRKQRMTIDTLAWNHNTQRKSPKHSGTLEVSRTSNTHAPVRALHVVLFSWQFTVPLKIQIKMG